MADCGKEPLMKSRTRYITDVTMVCVVTVVMGSLANCAESPPVMQDEIATAMPTATPLVDSVAADVTATAIAALQTIEAALESQTTMVEVITVAPTPTVNTLGNEATLQAAVNATLTALVPTSTPPPTPTSMPTPNLNATETANASWLVTAVAATLTAQAQIAATQTAQVTDRTVTTSSTGALIPASLDRIRFPSGSTVYTFSTQFTSGVAHGYVLRTVAGQHLFVTSTNVTHFVVRDPDQVEVTPFSISTGQMVFPLPKSGDYTLIIAGSGRATITIDVPPLPEQIHFTLGSTGTTFTIQMTEQASHAYTLWVAEGQQIFVTVNQPIALFALAPAGHELIATLHDPFQWQFTTTQAGNHQIFLKGAGAVTVTITVPPL